MGAWDVLWSTTAKAVLAADLLRPGQLLATIPGFLAVSRKTTLVTSLLAMYGSQGAWKTVPRWVQGACTTAQVLVMLLMLLIECVEWGVGTVQLIGFYLTGIVV